MPTFRYRAFDRSGTSVAGMVAAADRAAAVARLHADGLLPVEVVEAIGGAAPAPVTKGKPGRRPRRFALVVRQLATLVGAGVPLDRALGLVAELEQRGPTAALARRLQDRLRGGAALSRALAEEAVNDPVAVALIEAGEAGGRLDDALERLAQILERSESLAQSIRSALVYPVTLLVVAAATIAILMTLVLPRFGEMFARAGQEVPLFTRVLLDLSAGLGEAAPFLAAALVAAWLGARLAGRRSDVRAWGERLRYRLPLVGGLFLKTEAERLLLVLGGLFLKTEAERLLRVLGGLAAGGVALPRAVELAAAAGGTVAMERALGQVAARVREGQALGDALAEIGWFPVLAVELVRIGEATGRLEPMMIQAADIYDREVRSATARLVALLAPALTVALGVVVGTIVLALISSVVELYAIVD